MKNSKLIYSIVSTLALLCFAISTEAQNTAKGQQYYLLCQTCHGQNAEGSQTMNAPKLAGQHDWYLIRQIKNFKASYRGIHPNDILGAQCRPMTMTLPDEQAIKDVVAYIKTL